MVDGDFLAPNPREQHDFMAVRINRARQYLIGCRHAMRLADTADVWRADMRLPSSRSPRLTHLPNNLFPVLFPGADTTAGLWEYKPAD